jgi:hypothetical protein
MATKYELNRVPTTGEQVFSNTERVKETKTEESARAFPVLLVLPDP